MRVIKEYSTYGAGLCIVRSNTYSSSLGHLHRLLAVAREDFPNLTPESVEVVLYGGDSYSGTYGIEFRPAAEPPARWQRVSQAEVRR